MKKWNDARILAILLAGVMAVSAVNAVAQDHGASDGHGNHAASTHAGDSHDGGSDDAAHGDGHEQPTLFTGDLGNIFWSWLTFLIVIGVLGKFAWKPILTSLQQREEFIRDSLAKAKQDRESAEASMKEYEQRLQAAREEATAMVEEGRRDAEVLHRKIEQEARDEATAMLDRAKSEISLARDTAIKELYGLTAQLATEVAGKIVGKELNAADHERLVSESVDELSKLHAN